MSENGAVETAGTVLVEHARNRLALARNPGLVEKIQRDPIVLWYDEDGIARRAFLSCREAEQYQLSLDPENSGYLYVVSLHADRRADGSELRALIEALADRVELLERLLALVRIHVGFDGEVRRFKLHCDHPYLIDLGQFLMEHFSTDDPASNLTNRAPFDAELEGEPRYLDPEEFEGRRSAEIGERPDAADDVEEMDGTPTIIDVISRMQMGRTLRQAVEEVADECGLGVQLRGATEREVCDGT